MKHILWVSCVLQTCVAFPSSFDSVLLCSCSGTGATGTLQEAVDEQVSSFASCRAIYAHLFAALLSKAGNLKGLKNNSHADNLAESLSCCLIMSAIFAKLPDRLWISPADMLT